MRTCIVTAHIPTELAEQIASLVGLALSAGLLGA